MTLRYSPFDESLRDDPFPVYRRLRDEAPLYWTDDPGAWVVSRYEDAVQVLKRPELFSSDAMGTVLMGVSPTALRDPASDPEGVADLMAFAQAMPFEMSEFARGRNLIASDGADHDGLRATVNRGFTPRRIAIWEARIRELVDECMQKARRGEAFDVVADLAVPVPTMIIAEMLGIDPERGDDFKRWSDGIIASVSGSGRKHGFQKSGSIEVMREFAEYFVEIGERRKREPKDDLTSLLMAAEPGERPLTPMELVTFGITLLVAGNETTTNLVGSAAHALLDHPDQLARVNREPSLIPSLVEETLRYQSPIQFLARRATREVEFGGGTVPADEVVIAILGSANRDQRYWGPDADEFDVARNPQGHLGFGFGVHFCLGASLARLEARCMLEGLIPELARLGRRAPGVEYTDSSLVRGLTRLELAAAPA